jgi:hypothetical protein
MPPDGRSRSGPSDGCLARPLRSAWLASVITFSAVLAMRSAYWPRGCRRRTPSARSVTSASQAASSASSSPSAGVPKWSARSARIASMWCSKGQPTAGTSGLRPASARRSCLLTGRRRGQVFLRQIASHWDHWPGWGGTRRVCCSRSGSTGANSPANSASSSAAAKKWMDNPCFDPAI